MTKSLSHLYIFCTSNPKKRHFIRRLDLCATGCPQRVCVCLPCAVDLLTQINWMCLCCVGLKIKNVYARRFGFVLRSESHIWHILERYARNHCVKRLCVVVVIHMKKAKSKNKQREALGQGSGTGSGTTSSYTFIYVYVWLYFQHMCSDIHMSHRVASFANVICMSREIHVWLCVCVCVCSAVCVEW